MCEDQDQYIAEVKRCVIAIHRAMSHHRQATSQFGLGGAQLAALRLLTERGPMRLGELAGELYRRPSSTSALIDRLEELRLVRREQDPEDRRAIRVVPTAEGRRIGQRIPPSPISRLLTHLQFLSLEQLGQIAIALRQVTTFMETQNDAEDK
ncbi:MAG: MarR family transcriptional regulator [Anaerolineae bacterium]|nr:MarR family transcriptional regulator [Anaerolineae bacterium]